MRLISEELNNALIEQWGHEVFNSHIYITIMAFFKNKGLDNIAKLFQGQHQEEQNHAQIILNLLTDLNSPFDAPTIDEFRLGEVSFMEIAKMYADREIQTTESLNVIKELAIDERNPVVEEKIREMISLQQHEYEEALTFLDKAEILGNDWKAILLYDASLG